MIKYQKLNSEHISQVAKIQKYEIDSFLSYLPLSYINYFYTKTLNNDKNFGVVAISDNKVIGFILGSLESNNLFKNIICSNIFKFIIALIKLTFAKPKLIKHLLIKRNQKVERVQLLFIAVCKSHQSKGVSHKMLEYFEHNFLGVKTYYLEVKKENEKAIKFYRKKHFVKSQENQDSYVFKKIIQS